MKKFRVDLSRVRKQLKQLPLQIVDKLWRWARGVEAKGVYEVRKLPGYHDEPLKGNRLGQRSIRLSRSYRAIYREEFNGDITLIIVEEVNKHEY